MCWACMKGLESRCAGPVWRGLRADVLGLYEGAWEQMCWACMKGLESRCAGLVWRGLLGSYEWVVWAGSGGVLSLGQYWFSDIIIYAYFQLTNLWDQSIVFTISWWCRLANYMLTTYSTYSTGYDNFKENLRPTFNTLQGDKFIRLR